jgi:hypothetical protein
MVYLDLDVFGTVVNLGFQKYFLLKNVL